MPSSAVEGRETHSDSIRHNYGAYFCYCHQNILIPHLHSALREKEIHSNIDDYELARGEEISDSTPQAIEESSCSIVVFCPGFPFSTRCLAELDIILECRKRKNQLVYPIFFQIDPSEVRKQEGNYAKAMQEHRENFEDELIKVCRWSVNLFDAANLAGRKFDPGPGSDPCEFTQKIAGEIIKQLNSTRLCNADSQAGQESQLTGPQRLLVPGPRDEFDAVGKNGIQGIAAKFSIKLQNVPNITQPHSSFISSHTKELENGEILLSVQLSTGTASTSKERGETLGPKMGGIEQPNVMSDVQVSEKNDTRKRIRISDGATFNDETHRQRMQTPTKIACPQLSGYRANQESLPREVLGGMVSREPNDRSMEAFSASPSAENTPVSAMQDAGSMSLGTTEEMNSALQTLQTRVSKRFCELIPDRTELQEHIQNISVNFSSDDKISQKMGLILQKLLRSFTQWCQDYDAADTRLKRTNADLSKHDVLEGRFADAVIKSKKALSDEDELSRQLGSLQDEKRKLEAQLKGVKDKIAKVSSARDSAKATRESFVDNGKRLKTEKDNWEVHLPRIKGEQEGAIKTQNYIEAEWYKLGEEFRETLMSELGSS